MQSVTVHPSAIRPEVIDAARMVGKIVTYRDRQYKVHSVEGPDYYAFGSKIVGDDTITIDFDMAGGWRPDTYAYIIPCELHDGDGWGTEVPVGWLKPGVCLVKQGQSVWH